MRAPVTRCAHLPILAASLLFTGIPDRHAQDQPANPGIVVESVAASGTNDAYQKGDVIQRWSRTTPASPKAATGGRIDSPLDIETILADELPRGPIALTGIRAGRPMSWTLNEQIQRVSMRPQLTADVLAAYGESNTLFAAKRVVEASAKLTAAAAKVSDPRIAIWLFARAAVLADQPSTVKESDAARRRAIQIATDNSMVSYTSLLLTTLGRALESRRDLSGAAACYRDVVSLHDRHKIETLTLASALLGLSIVASDPATSQPFGDRAFAIAERLAPEGRLAASIQVSQAVNAIESGDYRRAENKARGAMAIFERLRLFDREFTLALSLFGDALARQGDFAAAEEPLRRALRLRQQQSPNSVGTATMLRTLGALSESRGDYASAEDYLGRALAIHERVEPESPNFVATLWAFGYLSLQRGDAVAARKYYERSLALELKRNPQSEGAAFTLRQLSIVAALAGNESESTEYVRRALALLEKVSPESMTVAATLSTLAIKSYERGDFAAAEGFAGRGVRIIEKLKPGDLLHAQLLDVLGLAIGARGDLAGEMRHHRAALAIRAKLPPGAVDSAVGLHRVALELWRRKEIKLAQEFFDRMLSELEADVATIGSDEARAMFTRRLRGMYASAMTFQLAQNRKEAAFGVAERSRARSFLRLLSERDLTFNRDVPAALEKERRRINAEYDRVQSAAASSPRRADFEQRLRDLQGERDVVNAKIRQAAPGAAALRSPERLDLAAIRRALDPGTVLLSYVATDSATVVFVVTPAGVSDATGGLSVTTLDVSIASLRDEVGAFRKLIQEQEAAPSAQMRARARALYDRLIKPVEAWIQKADRVVICPDGPLHVLPFGALLRQVDGATQQFQYFAEWKPLHISSSGTVYARIKATRRPRAASQTVVAFADPNYTGGTSADDIPDLELRAAVRGGLDFRRLPYTRREAEAIAGAYPQATILLGDRATEEQAKGLDKTARIIHFATHGYVDSRIPLNSALVLTIPQPGAGGQQNGLFQAWEVFEQIRIDADLVTLSACETALGNEMGSEGLLGLTRAFQYAGARSVLASLWSVADDSTAVLMGRFYRYLKSGQSKDRALQSAQVDMIRSARSHPFHWAAFELFGDWQF